VGARTAAEVVAELERRKREDPAYRAELERVESERAERTRLLRIAEQPVVDDLRAIGLDLDTVWDLYKIPDSRPQAIPVLLKHLALDYPDRVLEGIGQGLDDRSARAFWSDLRAMLLNTDRDVVRDRVAAALSGCATREHYDDLLAFIRNNSLGHCRIYFLRPINRIGNRISPGQGRAVIESVAEDPTFGKEAAAILKGRSRNQ
jgi:hypothetical protein